MAKIEKLIERLLSYPVDFTWEELIKILTYCGYRDLKTGKTSGSRRKFVDETFNIISLHKPHPGNILKRYMLIDVITHLKVKGKLKNE